MPLVRVACGNGFLYVLWLVDGQVKYLYSLAALVGCGGVGIVATDGVGHTMPLVRVACSHAKLYMLWLVESQVESNDTIAAIGSYGGKGVLATLGVGLTVPLVTIASGDMLLCINSWINCEVEDMLDTINVGTCIFLCIGIFACCRIRLTIPYIRCFCLTDSYWLLIMVACSEYCQIQYMDSTIAGNGGVLLYNGILTCSGIGITAPSVWQFIATNYYGFGGSYCLWHDSELECSHAITAEGVG